MADPLALNVTVTLSPENLEALAGALVPYLPAAVVDPPVEETPEEPPTDEPPVTDPPVEEPVDEEPPVEEPPVSEPPAEGTITHGRQITALNTGHTAYLDPDLGRLVTDSDLVVHERKVSLSDLGVPDGGTVTRHWFKGGLNVDRSNVTLVACQLNARLVASKRINLRWCTIDGLTPASPAFDEAIVYGGYTAYRSRLCGGSDGAKINGDVEITECWVRTKRQSSSDHNDGLQNYAGRGDVTVRRSNIDARPVNATGAFGNAAIFVADGAQGHHVIEDNLLQGGGYCLRAHESATYAIRGNDIVEGTFQYQPWLHTNAPSRDIEWATDRPNRVVTETGELVSIISLD